MSTDHYSDAEAFYQFLGEQLQNGGRDKAPEALLNLWRLRQQPEYAESVEALREALTDMEHGDLGKPMDEFLDEFRKKHSLPLDS